MTLDELRPSERRTIQLLDGLLDGRKRSIEEVAKRFQVTPRRLREIERSARKHLVGDSYQ